LYLLGIDAGTHACKSVLYNLSGKMIAQGYGEYTLSYPKANWVVFDPERFWHSTAESMRDCLRNVNPNDVGAVGVASQAETAILINGEGRHVYPAISWLDQRAESQREWLSENFGRYEIYKITGQPLHSMFTINKLMWLRENEPRILEKAKKVLSVEDYIIFKLSGNYATDQSIASRTMMFDVMRRRWSKELLDLAGIAEESLPNVYPSGTIVGEVHTKASKETSLKKGTIVTTGGHDHPCGALAVGIIRKGPMLDSIGTSESVMVSIDKPILTKEVCDHGFSCYCSTLEGKYVVLGGLRTAGAVLTWFRDQLGEYETGKAVKGKKSAYNVLMEEAEKSQPGASGLLLLPHFMGSSMIHSDARSKGAILGLTLSHKKADIIRAILEGVSFEIRSNIASLEELVKTKVTELRCIGGGTRSMLWLKIRANITGRRVVLSDAPEATSLGASICAGIGAGVYRDAYDAIKKVYRVKRIVESKKNMTRLYDKYYRVYETLYPALREISWRLDDIVARGGK